ncbi:MAG: ComF family protein [Bacteroidaceae bacterium]|nr:ComF family protein [Bacteroidaceae bacterium]
MRGWLRDIADFFFPRTCRVCGKVLLHDEGYLCMQCMLDMPRTDFGVQLDNAMAQLFYGKIAVERAVAYFYFTKGSDYRRLIHRIKYNGEKECGRYLGKMMARELITTSTFKGIDYIVPVPLHRSKERKRGYNQSEWIAQGIADETGIPLCTDALVCRTHRESQTQKGIYDRYLATREAFELLPDNSLQGSHVLLVDDVVTTGATLLACGETLLKGGVRQVSVATLAAAKI